MVETLVTGVSFMQVSKLMLKNTLNGAPPILLIHCYSWKLGPKYSDSIATCSYQWFVKITFVTGATAAQSNAFLKITKLV